MRSQTCSPPTESTAPGRGGAWSRSRRACWPRFPFVDLPFFVGPAAEALGEVDIAFIVGLLVSGVVYIAVTRSLGRVELNSRSSTPTLPLADPASTQDIATTVAEENR